MALRLNVANRQAVYFNHMKVTANVTNGMLRLSYTIKSEHGAEPRITEPLTANDSVTICGVVVRVLGIADTQVSRLDFAAPPAIVINKQKFYESATQNSGGYVIQRGVYNHFYHTYGLSRADIEALIKQGTKKPDADNAKAGEIMTLETDDVKTHKLFYFSGVIHDVQSI